MAHAEFRLPDTVVIYDAQARVASRSTGGGRKLIGHPHDWNPATSLITIGASGKVVMDENRPHGAGRTAHRRVRPRPRHPCGQERGRPRPDSAELVTVGITPDASPSAPLLPKNDRTNQASAVSPNGKQFVFASVRKKSVEYHLPATRHRAR